MSNKVHSKPPLPPQSAAPNAARRNGDAPPFRLAPRPAPAAPGGARRVSAPRQSKAARGADTELARQGEAPAFDQAREAPWGCLPRDWPGKPGDGGGSEADDEADAGAAGGAGSAPVAGVADDALDCADLARLLPGGANDGVFDVLLPNGERMGVVVSGKPAALSYLLSPASESLGARLRRQRMELEQRLERLTHRNVSITVL